MIVIVLMKHNNSFNKFPGMYEKGGTPSIEIVTSGFAGRAGLAKQVSLHDSLTVSVSKGQTKWR